MINKKDKKQISFHEVMMKKAQVEVDFWKREVTFHEHIITKLMNKNDKFI